MTDVVLSGNYLRDGRSIVFADGGGVTWTLSDGNRISISEVSGATIPPGSISNVDLANMAQATIKGRAASAGTGDPTDLSASQVKTILGISLSSDVTGTLQAAQFPALTGDVTTSAGSLATTIANDAVSYAKLQNLSSENLLLGRLTGGAGDVEELNPVQARTVLGPDRDLFYSKQVPMNGFSITVGDSISTLVLDPAGALLTGAVTLPANPVASHIVRICSSQAIATLTVLANGGQSLANAFVASLAAGTGIAYIYILSNTTWYRLY